jgi:hypothetical protein
MTNTELAVEVSRIVEEVLVNVVKELCKLEHVEAVGVTFSLCLDSGAVLVNSLGNAPKEVHTAALLNIINGDTQNVELTSSRCH